jgi:L-amino acid N-acyltransferase YncA
MRLRPLSLPGVACAWLYLHDPSEYQSSATRRGFRNLLELLPAQQSLKRLLVPTGPHDGALALFLQATGFQPSGVQREALYLHGTYHDLKWFSLPLESKG